MRFTRHLASDRERRAAALHHGALRQRKVNVNLGDAIRALDLHGSHGPIDVTIPATPKAVVSIVADTGDEITLRLPRDFAADLISLETTGFIDTTAFPDVQSGKPRGAAGTGAKSITLRAGAGRITLLAR